jgi:hypothetical protein
MASQAVPGEDEMRSDYAIPDCSYTCALRLTLQNDETFSIGRKLLSLRLVRNPSERFQTSWNDNHEEREL